MLTNQSLSSALGQNDNPADSFSLSTILPVLRKRIWMILAILVAVPTLVGFLVSKQPKVYEATAKVIIEGSVPQYLGQQFRDVVEIGNNWWQAQEKMQTELTVLGSYREALAVAQGLCERNLLDGTVALRKLQPGLTCERSEDLNKLAPLLQDMVRATPLKDSRVVLLTVNHSSPELAAVIANTAAQVYAEQNLNRRMSQSDNATTWLGKEDIDLSSRLNQAEQQLINFKRKNNVVTVSIEDQQNDLSSRHKKLSDELNGIQVKLIALRAARDQYAALRTDDPLHSISPALENLTVAKLKELYVDQQGKLLELRGKYLDKHPSVIAQEARVNAIHADLEREIGLANRNLEAQYQILVKQEKELRSALDNATHESLQLEQRAIEYNRLRRQYDDLAKLSAQVGTRRWETTLAGQLKTNNVTILDAALIPTVAIAPNVPRAVGLGALAAIVLALGLAFLLETLDSTVKTQDDIEKTIGLAFLGLIPTIDPETTSDDPKSRSQLNGALARIPSKDLYVLSHPKSSVAECCRAIRTNLLFMRPDNPPRSLLITSAGPQEGKTTSAITLAIIMAQSGLRVLLVDTDMRRPRLHKAFGIPSTPDGLSKLIVGGCEIADVVRETGVPNLFLVPCGATPPNPAELLHADRFKSLVAELSRTYDRVIFDSPPVGAVTDASILSRLTSGTVLVAKGGRTSKEALLRAARLLSDGRINLLGCILNDLDLSKRGSYGYYYYYSRYGQYYRDSDDEGSGTPRESVS